MKRSLFLFFVAMACGTLAFADEDVTATYIQNPSFETPVASSSLTADTSGDRKGTGAYVVTDEELTDWTLVAPTNGEDASRAVCDIMTADAVATDDAYGAPGSPSDGSQMLYLRNSWTTNTASVKQTLSSLPAGYYRLTVDSKCVSTINSHYAQLVAGTKSSALTVHSVMPDGWDTTSLVFEVKDGDEVTIGVEVSFDGHPGLSVLLDNFKLYSLGDMGSNSLVAHECTAEIGDWTTTGNNGTHEQNTWSTESDDSGMTFPFCQNWIASGSTLTPATISHKTFAGLPAGVYDVSMDIRILNENATTIGKGTLFKANGVSEDLDDTSNDGQEGASGSNPEVYGNYKLTCEVDEDGLLNISIVIPANATYNWIAWKNLKVEYMSSDTTYPTLSALTADMNTDVESAMETALSTYNSSKSETNFQAAVTALMNAQASVEYYAPIVAAVESLSLAGNEAGLAVWNESTYATALTNHSLSNEDVSDVLAAAQILQTASGSDMDYVAQNLGSWIGQTGTYQTGVERYQSVGSYTAANGKILYKQIFGLQPGTYEVTFFGTVNSAWEVSSYGSNIAQAFANEAAIDIPAIEQNFCSITYGDYLHTLTCTVGIEGKLEFGLQNVGEGGNWYVCQAVGLKLVEATNPVLTAGDEVYSCVAEIDHWTIDDTNVTDDNFHVNTWSTELDASGMITPLLEYWVYTEGSATLPAATISHETIEGLTPGVYAVGLDIRIMDDNTTTKVAEGTTFNANGVSEDLLTGDDANDDSYNTDVEDVYGTYTLTCTVGTDGKLDISIVIPDGVTYDWIAFKNLTVTYLGGDVISWTLGADYGTLILPFDYTLPEELTAYTVDNITDAMGDESATLELSAGITSIEANTPYIIGGTADEYTFIGIPTNDQNSYDSADGYLTGVLETTEVPNDGSTYVLQNQDSGLAFYLVASEDITCGAYHCYLNYPAAGGNAKLVVYFPDSDVATAIEAVEATEETGSEAIYDLSGRRVAKAQKGVYIVNGKKMVIK